MVASNQIERSRKSAAELVALIDRFREVWWPDGFELVIERTAEHDWMAMPVGDNAERLDLILSVADVVSRLRIRNAWNGE